MKRTLIISCFLCMIAALLSSVTGTSVGAANEVLSDTGTSQIRSTDSENPATQEQTKNLPAQITVFGQSVGVYQPDWIFELTRLSNDKSSENNDEAENYIRKRRADYSLMLNLTLPAKNDEEKLQLKVGLDIQQLFGQENNPPTTPPTITTQISATNTTTAAAPTTTIPTTLAPTTMAPTTVAPTTAAPTTAAPATVAPTTAAPTTVAPTTVVPTTAAPTTAAPTTKPLSSATPTTAAPTTTVVPTTVAPTTQTPTTATPTTQAPVTEAPVTTEKPAGSGAIPEKVPAMEYSEDDLLWLARIIEAEVGNVSMNSKIAVGTVVLNRVESSKFPNTIYDVIFQKNQFSPVKSGSIYKTPSEDSFEAARRCLEGERTDRRILYFMMTKSAPGSWMDRTRELIVIIDSESFYA